MYSKALLRKSSDLAGTRHVDGSAVRGGGHIVAVGHHFYQDVLRLQVVDEAGDVRLCLTGAEDA